MADIDQKMLRIGVFYDGGFFYHVSNYYRYSHARRSRLSISGIHEFIRQHAATAEGVDIRYSQIVDAHFFRGRFSALRSQQHDRLYAERAFDDVLMNEGVTTHYLPIIGNTEKGIDVWLSLEAFELAVHKRYNILVLIAGDSDFVPLVRKVNSLGSRVMLLGWDFEYTDSSGVARKTATSARLLNEVTYPVMMQNIIDDKSKRNDRLIDGLFLRDPPAKHRNNATASTLSSQESNTSNQKIAHGEHEDQTQCPSESDRIQGTILNLREGFGFIKCPERTDNVFFHFSSLVNRDFEDLEVGDIVTFVVVEEARGPNAQDVKVVDS